MVTQRETKEEWCGDDEADLIEMLDSLNAAHTKHLTDIKVNMFMFWILNF